MVISGSNQKNKEGKSEWITSFYSINPVSKQKKEIYKLSGDFTVNEAKVSPDGTKLYYQSVYKFDMTNKITILSNTGEKKEYALADSSLWTLDSTGSCYWSNDSSKIACQLIERDNIHGAGTGLVKITSINLNSGEVTDVIKSDQIAKTVETRGLTHLLGWINEGTVLLAQEDSGFNIDTRPTTYYFLDINTKKS